MKTKDISQWVEVDTTPPSPVGSMSVGISPDVTLGGDHTTGLNAKQVEEKFDLLAAIGIKMNTQK